jgi:predicted nucleic acid-binding protein
MTHVFDTSSLMAVLLDDETPDIDVLFDEHTLGLTFYEAGNVVWKAATVQKRIDTTEAERLLGILEDLRLELTVHELSELGMDAVYRTATETGLTFYDAAHLSCADILSERLVTEDSALRDESADVVSVCELTDESE